VIVAEKRLLMMLFGGATENWAEWLAAVWLGIAVEGAVSRAVCAQQRAVMMGSGEVGRVSGNAPPEAMARTVQCAVDR